MVEKICTRPTAVDFDVDGDLDLVVGNFAGTFYLFEGQGEGKFLPQPEPIRTGEAPLKVDGAHSDPFLVDWDGDGDVDLLSGSSNGGVYWSENTAGEGNRPELLPLETLIPPGQSVAYGKPLDEDDLVGPTTATRVWVADVNEDGKLDVLVGDTVTLVAPAAGLSDEEFASKSDAWQKAWEEVAFAVRDVNADAEERASANARLNELYQQRSEFIKEERTGFVWLYLQE